MKTCKLLFIAIAICCLGQLRAQIDPVSSVSFNYFDLLNYSSYCTQDMVDRVVKNYSEGKTKLYADAMLKKPLSYDEYYKMIEVKKPVQIPNPANPDDIYDLIDTVIIFTQGPRWLIVAGNVVEIVCENGAKMYIGKKQLLKLFDERLKSLLNYAEQNGIKELTDYNFSQFWKTRTTQLGKALYNLGISGAVKPYRNPHFDEVFTLEELTDRVTVRENKQIQNPDNPDDIYDLVDTVISIPFVADSINTIRLMFEWETEEFEAEAEFFAIGPSFRPVAAGLLLPHTPIFLISAGEYLKTINKQEKAFWPYFYSFMLQNRSANNEYDFYNEENPPAAE